MIRDLFPAFSDYFFRDIMPMHRCHTSYLVLVQVQVQVHYSFMICPTQSDDEEEFGTRLWKVAVILSHGIDSFW